MSNRNHPSNPSRTPSAPASSMERRMDLDLDYARVRAALDLDAIAAGAVGREQGSTVKEASATVILSPDTPMVAGVRRRSRALQAACVAAVLLITTGLVAGGGWLVANRGDINITGTGGLPPLFPWIDRNEEPADPSLDGPHPAGDATDDVSIPEEPGSDAEINNGGMTMAPTKPSAPDTMAPAEEPSEPDGEPATDTQEEIAPNPDDTAPFGPSVTMGDITYYDTGYAIPLGTLKDRLETVGAVADGRVCYAVVGLDSARYIVATAHDCCYLYKTESAPDPAAWLEAWLDSLQP